MQNLITSSYEHQLAYHYHQIDKRGLLIDVEHKKIVEKQCIKELQSNCDFLSNLWNINVYVGANNKPPDNGKLSMNLNANSGDNTVLINLTRLGYKVPKIRKKNTETDEYEMSESAGEMALVKLLAAPGLWPSASAGEGIKKLLETREIITFRNRYINATLYKNVYLAMYNVASTVTGRRGSKKSIFGFGGNAQNFPSRGTYADEWKKCIISRPNKVFFMVDQISAEDWPVQALSENTSALQQMRDGVNRHYIFASQIFGVSIDELKKRRGNKDGLYCTKELQDEAELQYYMGKKARHSNNYGMQPTTFSEALAKEAGYTVTIEACKNILNIVDRVDPNVKRIFHNYIQKELAKPAHLLQTPLGRERAFLGLRSGEKNYSILNEAYSYIPQSTVGDNTGLAVCELERDSHYVVQEGHDSICQEIPDNENEMRACLHRTKRAFSRIIKFHNGVEIEIPIEGMIGRNWKDKYKLEKFNEDCLIETYRKMRQDERDRDKTKDII